MATRSGKTFGRKEETTAAANDGDDRESRRKQQVAEAGSRFRSREKQLAEKVSDHLKRNSESQKKSRASKKSTGAAPNGVASGSGAVESRVKLDFNDLSLDDKLAAEDGENSSAHVQTVDLSDSDSDESDVGKDGEVGKEDVVGKDDTDDDEDGAEVESDEEPDDLDAKVWAYYQEKNQSIVDIIATIHEKTAFVGEKRLVNESESNRLWKFRVGFKNVSDYIVQLKSLTKKFKDDPVKVEKVTICLMREWVPMVFEELDSGVVVRQLTELRDAKQGDTRGRLEQAVGAVAEFWHIVKNYPHFAELYPHVDQTMGKLVGGE